MSFKTKIVNTTVAVVGKLFTGTLSQEERAKIAGKPDTLPETSLAARTAAAESAVLLENNGVLPLASGEKIAVFGRVQLDCFAVGYGSGGDVNTPYTVNFLEGLENSGAVEVNRAVAEKYRDYIEKNPADHGFWGHWPRCHPEMPLEESFVASAAAESETAVVFIGRSSGEDRENALEKGSWYLTDEEEKMLGLVTAHFKKTAVVLNIGGIMDMSWVDKYKSAPLAVISVWQGGMECGNAAADVLTGKTSPSGRLSDTVAKKYEDYPSSKDFGGKAYNNYTEDIFVGCRYFETFAKDRVKYPFGFGLSYTDFDVEVTSFSADYEKITVSVSVENTGTVAAKEVIQIYFSAPSGLLGKAARSLAAFAKTSEIKPGEKETAELSFDISDMASYDASGKTGNKSAFVLEAGDYEIFVGKNIRDCVSAGKYTVEKTVVTSQLSEICAVEKDNGFDIITERDGKIAYEPVAVKTRSEKDAVLSALPPEIPFTDDRGVLLSDVRDGYAPLDSFIAQLRDKDLEALCRGDYTMNSPLGTPGNAAVCGGITETLQKKGVPCITLTDGPSGIRLAAYASLLPVGTALACTWNIKAVEEIYSHVSREMRAKGSSVLLAPGMNIHRNPLCGRNFEYYSEDPRLTGEIAAAAVTGIQSAGVSACPKHFACNNQEIKRNTNDSRVSERALREIYLRGFEICVKKAKPKNIMTSYNKVNGVWSHYNYSLCTLVLRGEWGYEGCVMTDWWMRPSKDPNFKLLKNNAYRVRAQVDLLMPGAGAGSRGRKYDKSLLMSLGKPGGITKGEIQRCAGNTLKMILSVTEK